MDPDPDTDPKKIIPDPQHWLEISFWRGGGLGGGGGFDQSAHRQYCLGPEHLPHSHRTY